MPNADPSKNFFAWHGWQLALPRSWNPVKIEGDWAKGTVLLADMDHPRLGVRWRKIADRRFNPAAWAQRAMRDEVGRLAAGAAKALPSAVIGEDSLVYLDDRPPGRDLCVGYSRESERAIEIIYHARRRDRVLTEAILPTLAESPPRNETAWSIFDLSCRTPAQYRLSSHQLMAGDLTFDFSRARERLTVRQIAVAKLALSRRSLSDWLVNQQEFLRPHYRPAGNLREIQLAVGGRELRGVARDAEKLKRFMLHRWLPGKMTTTALHDAERDRLFLFQGTDAESITQFAGTVNL